jgi:hypothetical protein
MRAIKVIAALKQQGVYTIPWMYTTMVAFG